MNAEHKTAMATGYHQNWARSISHDDMVYLLDRIAQQLSREVFVKGDEYKVIRDGQTKFPDPPPEPSVVIARECAAVMFPKGENPLTHPNLEAWLSLVASIISSAAALIWKEITVMPPFPRAAWVYAIMCEINDHAERGEVHKGHRQVVLAPQPLNKEGLTRRYHRPKPPAKETK